MYSYPLVLLIKHVFFWLMPNKHGNTVASIWKSCVGNNIVLRLTTIRNVGRFFSLTKFLLTGNLNSKTFAQLIRIPVFHQGSSPTHSIRPDQLHSVFQKSAAQVFHLLFHVAYVKWFLEEGVESKKGRGFAFFSPCKTCRFGRCISTRVTYPLLEYEEKLALFSLQFNSSYLIPHGIVLSYKISSILLSKNPKFI